MFSFNIEKEYAGARLGLLKTPHGIIHTPSFVPVATRGAIKGASFEDVGSIGADVFMINTFHFYCRDEHKVVKKLGGLHKFLNINYPLMTDSGGFQVFSLGAGKEYGVGKIFDKNKIGKEILSGKKRLARVKEDKVIFNSPFDGSKVEITPESSIKAQMNLGADLIFAFDECTSPVATYEYQKKSLAKTHRWAEKSLSVFSSKTQRMMGIVQGGRFEDLRRESARYISSLPFFGFGIGGSFGDSFGDSKENMNNILEIVNSELDSKKPRHFLGIGEPEDIIQAVKRGVDLFDCVIPTRFARHGTALTREGRVSIRSARHREDKGPVDKFCSCSICQKYSRGYIHHLIARKEIYGIMLLTHHNLYFILDLMRRIREAIKTEKSFDCLDDLD